MIGVVVVCCVWVWVVVCLGLGGGVEKVGGGGGGGGGSNCYLYTEYATNILLLRSQCALDLFALCETRLVETATCVSDHRIGPFDVQALVLAVVIPCPQNTQR